MSRDPLTQPCLRCGAQVSAAAKFCRTCGLDLAEPETGHPAPEATCPSCGAQASRAARFCHRCGTSLARDWPAAPSDQQRADEARVREPRSAADVAAAPRVEERSLPHIAEPSPAEVAVADPSPAARPSSSEQGGKWLFEPLLFGASRWQVVAIVLVVGAIAGAGAALLRPGDSVKQGAGSPGTAESPAKANGAQPSSADESGGWPPGRTAYTVIVATKKTRAATTEARADVYASGRSAGLLRSDDYATLNPGRWVVFVGEFPSAKAADRAAARLRREGFEGAHARLISAEPQEPAGTLTTTGVGPVQVGMTQDEVLRYFISPDRKEEVNFGGGPAPQVDWIWSFPDGDLRLQFENRGMPSVSGYVSTTAALATSSGATIGSSFAPIEERYGDQLRQAPIGEHTLLLSEGRPGTYPALSFTVIDTKIASISGGEPQPAGE